MRGYVQGQTVTDPETGVKQRRYRVWIRDVDRLREAAPRRDQRIRDKAEFDGERTRLAVESVAGYKDTYERFRALFAGWRSVRKVVPKGDLVQRAAPLESIFEAGNVILLRGAWNRDFIDECAQFGTGAAHDDQIAALCGLYEVSVSAREPTIRGVR